MKVKSIIDNTELLKEIKMKGSKKEAGEEAANKMK